MARSKQAAPLRRETSSEYTGKHDRSPNDNDAKADTQVAAQESSKDSGAGAGALQLMICVAGIYGSLSV